MAQKRKSTGAATTASPAKKPATTPAKSKPNAKPNGSILNFFKKAEPEGSILNFFKKVESQDSGKGGFVDKEFFIIDDEEVELQEALSSEHDQRVEIHEGCEDVMEGSGGDAIEGGEDKEVERVGCTPPPPDVANQDVVEEKEEPLVFDDISCPFMLDDEGGEPENMPEVSMDTITTIYAQDSKAEEPEQLEPVIVPTVSPIQTDSKAKEVCIPIQDTELVGDHIDAVLPLPGASTIPKDAIPPALTRLSTRNTNPEDDYIQEEPEFFDEEQDTGKWDDIEDDDEMGEEMINRRYMEDNLLDDGELEAELQDVEVVETQADAVSCPICEVSLRGIVDEDVTRHVNACLDGNPIPLPAVKVSTLARPVAKRKVSHVVGTSSAGSAFSKIMASHAEDRAWANAAMNEQTARGKRGFQRTCPFYKIMPNLSCAVDAFRYGAVPGMNAYFLSHFHSDHYIGLSASWCHGPIYCSRVTANLCRRQLRVDPKWMVELEYDVPVEVPDTGGATVTMIDANHCPGSSLFLLEKDIPAGRGKTRKQRILHCGDFRAHAKHLRHPLLSVLKGNKIDICYLDTTYMNPKYAFPPQQQVIEVCAELCQSLTRSIPDMEDNFEKTRLETGIAKFVQQPSDLKEEPMTPSTTKQRGKLLIVVGTYSIGKERICMGIAKALDCKIFAPSNKQKICASLEDKELSARLTTDPYAGQVHMTPLMEIRAETLRDYLQAYKPHFSRIVGFRPSGWNYRPPNSRFTESPSVQTVLKSPAWRSDYHISQLSPQRGSTTEARCYGVPYSEHSSFRELTTFCCSLDIVKIVPTVNVGSAKMREKMKVWFEKWAAEKKKNGFHEIEDDRQAL